MLDRTKPFGHFTILRMIGRGGMGVVYLARDERLGREVALKVLSEYDLPDGERRARFLREARAAAAVRHPNIATIYEVGESEHAEPYIAMEYCSGPTLSQVVSSQAVEPERFLRIARQLAEALAAAHHNGIVHRDIKSANVIVEEGDVVKILDFGLAKLTDRVSDSTTPTWARSSSSGFFGTVPYISPEQARGRPADDRSDLFSLGVVLYELATGKLPFTADNPLGVLERIRDHEPEEFTPRDPRLPAQVAAVIARLLQKNPVDRFQSAEELAETLRAIDDQFRTGRVPTRSLRFGPAGGFGRTVRHHSPILAVSIAAIAFVVLAAATIMFLVREDGGTADSHPLQSVAVLPLRNVSGQGADQFLSVGIADALVTRLQQIARLQVRPTSSVLGFGAGNVSAKEAGEQLDVDGVLEGHFLTSGSQIRINLQLTDTRTGYGIWAGSIDGERADLIGLMDEVSSRAATAFEKSTDERAPGRSVPRTKNQDAYERYLKARSLMGSLVREHHDEQVKLLQQAIELDPTFAAAYADLAIALSIGQTRGFGPDTSTYRAAEQYARQAVRLDPNLPDAHLALGRTLVRFPDRYREAVRENLAALRLDPNNPYALHTVVSFFVAAGDIAKTQCVGDRLVRIDPSSNNSRTRGYWQVNAVNPEEAIRLGQLALSSNETAIAGHDILGNAYIALGDLRAADVQARKAQALEPNSYIGKSLAAMVAAGRGDATAAEAGIASMRREALSSHWAALRVAQIYAKLGKKDEAIQWLRTSSELGNHSWYFMVRHPWLQPLQSEPEFQQIIGKMKADLDDVRDDVVGVYEMLCGSK